MPPSSLGLNRRSCTALGIGFPPALGPPPRESERGKDAEGVIDQLVPALAGIVKTHKLGNGVSLPVSVIGVGREPEGTKLVPSFGRNLFDAGEGCV
jgi:hypothetical protein